MATSVAFAQNDAVDTSIIENVSIIKDGRLDILEKFQVDMAKLSSRLGKGYRLFVLKTNNRDYAMKVRAYLLQNFPDQKVIMTYQSPFIKMKFGDFIDREEADKYKNIIMKSGVLTGGVYVIPDTIEIKPDKDSPAESG